MLKLLTPTEFSRILKSHPFAVTHLAREDKLPGFKVEGSWRFRRDLGRGLTHSNHKYR